MSVENVPDKRVSCETCDCQNRAEVYVSCEGEGAYPYCRVCAEILLRGGEAELGAVDDPVIRERDEARALLREVALSGVAFEDWRLGYVEIQIDRPTWDALAEFREAS